EIAHARSAYHGSSSGADGLRTAKSDIGVAVAGIVAHTIGSPWLEEGRATGSPLEDAATAKTWVDRVHPFPHIARQVERPIGRRAGGIATDGLGAPRVNCATGPLAQP